MTDRPKVVGFLSPSYVGTTVLSCILDKLPGVFSPGETHWLTEPRADPWRRKCSLCVEQCPVFSEKNLQLLTTRYNETGDWFGAVAGLKPSATILISSDKAPAYYDKLGRPDIALVVFRNPASWACSWVLRGLGLPSTAAGQAIHEDHRLFDAIGFWARTYSDNFKWAEKHNVKTIIMSWEKFATYTVPALQILCETLEIEFAPNLALPPMPTHQLGGNFKMVEGPLLGWEMLRNEAWSKRLTCDQTTMLLTHETLRIHQPWPIYKRLLEQDILWHL